ncbi:DUF1656 domain-containing protein [Achromobacter sp. SIMBA_011]|jgi:hypothetical protein|uniref:DUF1656 domain-containing protein n=2 Tax=Pseudomonadota TaxID=1224 RepID=UPI0006C84826|nr:MULTISPECIES: DUF1656 domain-containing protein [Achromobacter]MBQ2647227.1 DUF1656 domain-containing protein [Achromobacter sp.]MCZ8409402.1 DUF1656 domain-containing protein [Achromobacter dolens]MDC6161828.1 DUF1656 domain-containing protein [Achromobacter xylosoxidans]OAS98800.1 hypothetical protein A6I77_28010 [Achromobacter xylosoxidans]
MLSEFSLAGIYLPPFFAYACLALPIYLGLRFVLARSGMLRWVWHPGLFEFALSLCLVSLLVLYV